MLKRSSCVTTPQQSWVGVKYHGDPFTLLKVGKYLYDLSNKGENVATEVYLEVQY